MIDAYIGVFSDKNPDIYLSNLNLIYKQGSVIIRLSSNNDIIKTQIRNSYFT